MRLKFIHTAHRTVRTPQPFVYQPDQSHALSSTPSWLPAQAKVKTSTSQTDTRQKPSKEATAQTQSCPHRPTQPQQFPVKITLLPTPVTPQTIQPTQVHSQNILAASQAETTKPCITTAPERCLCPSQSDQIWKANQTLWKTERLCHWLAIRIDFFRVNRLRHSIINLQFCYRIVHWLWNTCHLQYS